MYLIYNNKIVFDQVFIQSSQVIRKDISSSAKELKVETSVR